MIICRISVIRSSATAGCFLCPDLRHIASAQMKRRPFRCLMQKPQALRLITCLTILLKKKTPAFRLALASFPGVAPGPPHSAVLSFFSYSLLADINIACLFVNWIAWLAIITDHNRGWASLFFCTIDNVRSSQTMERKTHSRKEGNGKMSIKNALINLSTAIISLAAAIIAWKTIYKRW